MKHTNALIVVAVNSHMEQLADLDNEIHQTEKRLNMLNQKKKETKLIIDDLEESLLTLNNNI